MTHPYIRGITQGLTPEARLTVSEWADHHRVLSSSASSEPGRWRTDRTPYLREIMDSLSSLSPVTTVVFMKGAQVGGTECGNNWIGYVIDQAPAPMLAVQPTVEMAKRVSKQRISPLIEACPRLNKKVKTPRARDSGNTILSKEFTGGVLILTGANSAVGLRSMPVRYLFLDEVDGYPWDIDNEGDPVDLAMGRTRTFARRKVFLVSTPTTQGRSRIEQAYLHSDQRRYHVPCPACQQYQVIRWQQLKWQTGQPETVVLVCSYCHHHIPEHDKTQMLAQGKWIATQPEATTRGYHLSSLYSPVGWFSWREAVALWEKAQGNPALLRVFVNTVLGETWQEPGEAPNWRRLYERRETYPVEQIPNQVTLLTAGADVQADRIECSLIGWHQQESWVISHMVLNGNPANTPVWKSLTQLLTKPWPRADGHSMWIRLLAIDCGFLTSHVYHWVRSQTAARVIAVKGRDQLTVPIAPPKAVDYSFKGRRIASGVKLWGVGVSVLKSDVYRRLQLKKPTDTELTETGYPKAFVHFPELGEDYFKQLTAEYLITRVVKGYRKHSWEQRYHRNEALDCFVYALAAYHVIGAHRWDETIWHTEHQRIVDEAYLKTNTVSLSKIKSDQSKQKNIQSSQPELIQRKRSSFW